LYPVAALWALSTAGAVQVTVRLLPVPCASTVALGAFGMYADMPVVSVLGVDHALKPAAFVLWI
jgi:hypothetical protein